MKSLKDYAELAHNILNSETQYKTNKVVISRLFEKKDTNDFESIVKNRISIIDSYYSTQMNKRLFGIDELASVLAKYSDLNLKTESRIFLNNPNDENTIKSLFEKKYGINKSGKPVGKATSLISKYLYFLNSYEFPIYDNLAIISFNLLKRNTAILNTNAINEYNYFERIKQLNIDSKINNYEKLDNLLWLIGKLSKGSFAILMNMDMYLELIHTTGLKTELLKPKNKKSSAKDEVVRNYIKEHYKTLTLFTEIQKDFFEFVFDL